MNLTYTWFILLLVYLYPFLFYPVILYVLVFAKKTLIKEKQLNGSNCNLFLSDHKLPHVSFIVSAFNEENVIEKKILNSLEIEYPKEKIEIIVVSDGSTDQTDDIVKSFSKEGVFLIRVKGREGKTACQNVAVSKAKGDILVFSDANTMYKSDSIKRLVTQLILNPEVGCVSGELIYKTANNVEKENMYWKYETGLKRLESNFYSEIGVNGAIYALRKSDYVPLRSDLISDFVEPLEIIRVSKKIVKHCDSALGYETEPSKDIGKSLIRKRRIFVRSIRGLLYEKNLCSPIKYPAISFELISHKVFRWINPIIAVFMMLLPLFNIKTMLPVFVVEYSILLLAVIGGMNVFDKYYNIKIIKLLRFLNYFLLLNIADLFGWLDLIMGKKYITWKVKR